MYGTTGKTRSCQSTKIAIQLLILEDNDLIQQLHTTKNFLLDTLCRRFYCVSLFLTVETKRIIINLGINQSWHCLVLRPHMCVIQTRKNLNRWSRAHEQINRIQKHHCLKKEKIKSEIKFFRIIKLVLHSDHFDTWPLYGVTLHSTLHYNIFIMHHTCKTILLYFVFIVHKILYWDFGWYRWCLIWCNKHFSIQGAIKPQCVP